MQRAQLRLRLFAFRDAQLMPYILHVPGSRPRHLRWTVHDTRSSCGNGVLLFRNTSDLLDGAAFRALRDRAGAWIETDHPERARNALGFREEESLGEPRGADNA